AYTLGTFWLGRRIFQRFWFERSLFTWGWATGVLANSIALVRVVDPQGRSRTTEYYAMAWFGNSWIELAVVAIMPMLIARGIVAVPMVVMLVVSAAALLLSKRSYGWSSADPRTARDGEAEALATDSP